MCNINSIIKHNFQCHPHYNIVIKGNTKKYIKGGVRLQSKCGDFRYALCPHVCFRPMTVLMYLNILTLFSWRSLDVRKKTNTFKWMQLRLWRVVKLANYYYCMHTYYIKNLYSFQSEICNQMRNGEPLKCPDYQNQAYNRPDWNIDKINLIK